MSYIKHVIILICFFCLPCLALDWRDDCGWFRLNTAYGYASGIEKAQFFNGQNWVDLTLSYTNGTVHYYSCTPYDMASLVQSLNPVYFRVAGDESNPFCKTYQFDNPDGHSLFSLDYYLSDGNSYSQPSFNVSDGRNIDVLVCTHFNSFVPPHVSAPVDTGALASDLLSLVGQAAGIAIGGICLFFGIRSAIRQYRGIGS